MRELILPVGAHVFFRGDADFACIRPVLSDYVRFGVIVESRGRDAGYPHYLVRLADGRTFRAALGELGLTREQPDSDALRDAFRRALLDAAEGPLRA